MTYVSFYDALRFANWLHNGQPTGAQDSSTTEDGAYIFDGEKTVSTRNPDATVFLPSEDEWYKAPYYDAVSMSYFDYPTGTDATTICATPGASANTANFGLAVGHVSPVGAYLNSPSPYGTFDQAGNVKEWNEEIFPPTSRGIRGGARNDLADNRYAGWRDYTGSDGVQSIGFRVPMIPEPSTALLLTMGLAGPAAAARRRSLH